ncbi:hypothetical protein E2N92_04235 [Methanofollis formosanus]|uniref:Uncharacterized protein n=1 Tax=Methanofollis formosanus TaxID=299308 RepID=A0A8G1EFF1_9EURY|nr:hypothetical protein [Methanofollis formosanus]QYZ78690.1 hypothetical protein E2N92_04235 [Methanofollis formosanus]
MQPEKTILILIIAAALLVPAAAAHDLRAETADQITVSSIPDGLIDLDKFKIGIRSVGGTIYPSEWDLINKYIPSNVETIEVYLDWSGHSGGPYSVALTIYPPGNNGHFGPYYDSADGRSDEKITLSFSDSSGLPSGTWQFYVFGDDVPASGISYTLNVVY